MDEIAAHGPLLSTSVVFSIFTILTQVTSFQLDFSGLKKKEFLTSHQQQLLQLAESLSQQKLLTTFDVHPTGEDPYQNRVKRGYGKYRSRDNPGFVALPLPSLPSNIDQSQAQLLSRPNRRLIKLANELSIKRQGVLPPTVNDPLTPSNELGNVEDPFYFSPPAPQSNNKYPNSIQDVLHEMDQEKHPEQPPSNFYNEILTPTTTKKPKKKKKVVYKVVTPKPNPHHQGGTTKKTIYKLVTSKTTTVPKKVESTTNKPKIIYHTRKPLVDDANYDHTRPVPPFPKVTPAPPTISKNPPTKNRPEDYMAVIPYKDVHKLFQMLNKHTKPVQSNKKTQKRKMRPTNPPLPPPTTKRTALLQPKVIKRTPLKGKKKKKRKKTVHVSHLKNLSLS